MNIRHWRIAEREILRWTVVETEVYLRSAKPIMDEEERAAVIDYLAAYPLAGDLVPGAGGIRKVRVPLPGRGKRGGGRVLTFFVKGKAVYLLLAYAKNDQANPTLEQARILARMIETLF
jgi:hypothetical protein